jgi:hypothetical protein
LISIHSAEENKFAMDLANRERTSSTAIWIGAKRNTSVDYSEWTNGQEFNYSNWRSGEPQNSADPESHVVTTIDGTWITYGKVNNDLWFSASFICERNTSDE